MRAVVEGPGVANALRELSCGIRDEAHEMWRRHWEAHTSESNTRLAALHMAQDAAGCVASSPTGMHTHSSRLHRRVRDKEGEMGRRMSRKYRSVSFEE